MSTALISSNTIALGRRLRRARDQAYEFLQGPSLLGATRRTIEEAIIAGMTCAFKTDERMHRSPPCQERG